VAFLLGLFNPRTVWPDRIAWEYDIFGDFACDLVIGDWARREYCFVEFEDARSNSIFTRRSSKATREWGRRFEHGYSQIIDWYHKLDTRPVPDLLSRFGHPEIRYEAVLVIGRQRHLNEGEQQRLRWRSEKVAVNNKKNHLHDIRRTARVAIGQIQALLFGVRAGLFVTSELSKLLCIPIATRHQALCVSYFPTNSLGLTPFCAPLNPYGLGL